jgi:cation transport regulator ChaC
MTSTTRTTTWATSCPRPIPLRGTVPRPTCSASSVGVGGGRRGAVLGFLRLRQHRRHDGHHDAGQLAQVATTPSGGSAHDTSYVYDAGNTLLLTADPTSKTLYLGG